MPGIGGGGFLGVALETTPGTYVAPTKFVPINSESVQYMQETIWRRPIRQSVDIVGAVDGDVHVEGDIEMEAFEDVVALMLHAARTSVVKSGSSPNFTYAFKGSAAAVPSETLSITIVRNGEVFGYTGCVLSSFSFSIEDGQLMFNCSILGRDEAEQSAPTPTWATTQTPFGAGKYSIEIPTATPVTDTDNFEFEVDDNGEPQFRLKNTGRGAQFIAYGERDVTMSVERDFENRDDYDAFKALTAQSITLTASKGANNSISLLMPASIKDEYELGLEGQGDLIRASVSYNAVIDATGNAYTITVKTQEDITP
jgi:hypothetical protein